MKMKPCCARAQARLTMNQAALRRLATTAARRSTKGLDMTVIAAEIQKAKVSIESDKKSIVEHEAEHAGEVS